MKLEFFRQIFEESWNMKFPPNPSSGSQAVPYRRSDITMLIVAFRSFFNAPENVLKCCSNIWFEFFFPSQLFIYQHPFKTLVKQCLHITFVTGRTAGSHSLKYISLDSMLHTSMMRRNSDHPILIQSHDFKTLSKPGMRKMWHAASTVPYIKPGHITNLTVLVTDLKNKNAQNKINLRQTKL